MRFCRAAALALFLPLLLVSLSLPAAVAAQQTSGPDVDAVIAAMDATGDALRAGDNDAFLAMYTDDVFFMPPNSEPSMGKDAMAASNGLDGPVAWRETYDEVMVHGDWAYVIGIWTVGEEATGKAIYILARQEDGAWRIAREFWNTDGSPGQE